MWKNNINYILESHKFKLLGWICYLIWYQSFDNQAVMSLNLIILIYLIKIKHKVVWIYTSFKPKEFLLKGMC